MIAGLEEISSGTISIGDKVVNNMPPKERDIAMVFQNYALYPHMTVARQHGVLAAAGQEDRATIDERVGKGGRHPQDLKALLERYPAPAFRRPAPARGDGLRHRAGPAGVPLFDEPLSNLDAKLRVAMRTRSRNCTSASDHLDLRPTTRSRPRPWPTRSS